MIVTNYQLLSHAYLSQLQADPAYDKAAAPIAQGLRDWMPFRDTSSLRALVDSWVGPVLDFLSFHHVSAGDAPHIRLLYARLGDESAIGLCYVVPPGQDLNDTIKGQHPMAQVILALRERDLRWGVLTDGSRWRLVDAQALRRYEHYLEVDLDALARSEDPTPLRLFYAVFHRDAFVLDEDGESGLDRLVSASRKATKTTEDHLKARVSHNEGIMAQLCMGLVRAGGRDGYTEAERDAIYRDATYLLYRMLFILYAEARGLLPVDHPGYEAVSLTELVQVAQTYKRQGMPDPQATTLWDRLKRLCAAIYESDPALGIPAYNGGLFDDADKPTLREGYIADAYLAEALFDLTYIADGGRSDEHRRIDYRDLSVRHLGSLYEGMIEYKLQIVEETLWARRDSKGNVRFLRTGEDAAPRKSDEEVRPRQVYFSQSPGERRATGTYYTPEYIVEYIVRQTVWQGLKERRAPLEERLAGWQEEIAGTTDSAERARMQRTADQELPRFVEEQVLTFRVCDPAMGSGHFLVNAAHHITNFVVETLHLTPWASERIDADPVGWRRRVVERCLYGVDLSLMAVELAKLSLWLASVAQGKPLSFLDHHLRQGNSLIGAWLEGLSEILVGATKPSPSRREQKEREAGQLSMLDDPGFSQHATVAADLLTHISARMAETVEDIKTQEADYERVRAELEPYRQVANLWIARLFGTGMAERELHAVSRHLIGSTVAPLPKHEPLLLEAQLLAAKQHFFHWELEFSEVFLNEKNQHLGRVSGFDAVIGNPPYVSMEGMEAVGRSYYYSLIDAQPVFESANDKSNLYAVFWEQAIRLTSQAGVLSLITPYSWLSNSSYRNLRRLFLRELDVREVSLLPHGVFDAGIATSILVAAKSRTRSRLIARDLRTFDVIELEDRLWLFHPRREIPLEAFEETEDYIFNLSWQPDKSVIIRKMHEKGTAVEELFSVDLGVKTANDRKYVGSTLDPDLNPKRLLTGKDFGRHSYHWNGLYVYYLPKQMIRERPTARPGEIQRFEKDEKIILYRFLDDQNRFICFNDSCQYYSLASTYVIAPRQSLDVGLGYVACILSSRLVSFFNVQHFSGVKVTRTELLRVPVRTIDFTAALESRTDSLERGIQLWKTCVDENDLALVLGFIEEELAQEPERDVVVHDLLAYLAQKMIDLNKERQRMEGEADLFRFVERDTPCMRLDKALGGPLGVGERVSDLSAIRHDIDCLCLSQEADGRWLLEVQAKLRDPESDWQEHQRGRDGSLLREWLPAYCLPLDEATGRFYHYAFAHLGGFDGAGKFPGGYTSTTLEKLKATKVPRFVPVDLAPLAALEVELAELRRRIQLTDDLIDQIVYKLYGLTEDEIAVVEGRA